ncbi:MAG: ribonuclease H [bacterium]|nr:ribonuclease H [bacterium]
MGKIIIFCDGASKGNPGSGGWGAIVATDTQVHELGGPEKKTTNNRVELRAALEALKLARTLGSGPTTVYTDSSYVINGITKWVHSWVRSEWRTKDKKEVMNQDLWKPLADTAGYFNGRITWEYIGGHVGIAGNERVDIIASDFAQGRKVPLYNGAREGYAIDIKNISFDKEKQKTKSDTRSRSKMKAHSYVSEIGGQVLVHKTWEECKRRVRGRSAKYKKSLSKEDEVKIIAEFSSNK